MASNISISVTNGNKQSNIGEITYFLYFSWNCNEFNVIFIQPSDVEGEKRLKHEYSLEEAVEATSE